MWRGKVLRLISMFVHGMVALVVVLFVILMLILSPVVSVLSPMWCGAVVQIVHHQVQCFRRVRCGWACKYYFYTNCKCAQLFGRPCLSLSGLIDVVAHG